LDERKGIAAERGGGIAVHFINKRNKRRARKKEAIE
jgi:hypothetical protein